jgi:hypothetical protein
VTIDSAARAGTWDQQLASAFEILLGRPLSSYDAEAVYAAYLDGNWFVEGEFHQAEDWVSPAALSGRETVVFDDLQLYYQGEVPLRFDASESWFEIRNAEERPATAAGDMAGLPAAAAGDLVAAFLPGSPFSLVRGRDLAAVVDRHGIDVAAINWRVAFPKMASDGSLLDAMRVATGIGAGPETLVTLTGKTVRRAEPEESWATALAAITPVELRDHLLLGCQERGTSVGLSFLGASSASGGDPLLPDDDCVLLACWDEDENQREVNVVQLSKAVAGRS